MPVSGIAGTTPVPQAPVGQIDTRPVRFGEDPDEMDLLDQRSVAMRAADFLWEELPGRYTNLGIKRITRHTYSVTSQPPDIRQRLRASIDKRYRDRVCQTVGRTYFTLQLDRAARPDAEALIRREFEAAFGEADVEIFTISRREPELPTRAHFLAYARNLLESRGLEVDE